MVPLSSIPDGYLLGLGAWLAGGAVALVACLRLRRRWRGRAGRLRWISALLSTWCLAATLTVVEVAVALFVDRTDSYGKTNISQRWFALHVRENAEGNRGGQLLGRPLEPGQKRVVFVGDSFTFGHGVEEHERFSDRIAAALDVRQPGKFVVANVSRPGNDARDVVRSVDRLLSNGTRIDILVYTFVPNDIEGFDERTAGFYQSLASSEPRCFLFRDTYFFNYLWYRAQALCRPESRDYYGYLRASYEGVPWQRLEAALDELVDTCRSRKIELRVVLFPFLHNLGSAYPFGRAHEKLAAYFESRGIACLDLRPVLEPHAREGLTVNASDAHPNPRAHAIAGEAMLDVLGVR